MQKQFIIIVDTSSSSAVSAVDTSGAPLTIPAFSSTCVPVAFYDGAKPVMAAIEDKINDAILDALRSA